MLAEGDVEWLREGEAWPDTEDPELRSRLIESGVIGVGQGAGLRIRFVGAIVFQARTLVSIPKVRTNSSPPDMHRKALRAMRRYREWAPSHHEPSPFLNESPDSGPVSGLAAADWLIRDFAAHGLIRRTETAYEVNGGGVVNWRRTVENFTPVMTRGRPVYLETMSRRSETDYRNFATRLHCFLLERLSASYGPVLDLEPIVLDHEPIERLDALPSIEECEARLAMEQRVTYSQRGIDLLAMMLATVKAIEVETEMGLSLFGTSTFHHVWEAACGRTFGNEVGLWQPYIPKPTWTSAEGQSAENDTFIPDLVTPIRHDELLIGDAKYYRPNMPPRLQNVPGVNDVAKQIWYKKSLEQEALSRGLKTIQNVFFFPADVPDVSLLGHVELPAGENRVDAIALPFTDVLSIFSGDKSHDPTDWRQKISALLPVA